MSPTGTARSTSRVVALGLVFLATALIGPGDSLGRDRAALADVEPPAPLAAIQVVARGPDDPMLGRRDTVEFFLFNAGLTPVKDVAFHARLDAHFEQDSKEPDHRVTVAEIAAGDVHVVRLRLTPRKVGPAGVEVTLRSGGATTQVSHVWPVGPHDPTRLPEKAQGPTPLNFKVTAFKECVVDRPGVVLVRVVNTDVKPMADKVELVISHAAMGRGGEVLNIDEPLMGIEKRGGLRGGGGIQATNPTRQVTATVPVLAPGEVYTVPVRVTPRRAGDIGVAVTGAKDAAALTLATARVAVKFDPEASHAALVPARAVPTVPTRLPRTLAEVPEVGLEDPAPAGLTPNDAFEHVAARIDKINHVNATKTDAFVAALVQARPDLAGLPFVMGDACRLSPEQGQSFQAELDQLRIVLRDPANLASGMPTWSSEPPEVSVRSRIAAMVQVTGPEGAAVGRQAVQYLASLPHADATKALANLALFAEDEPVRRDAVAALAKRPGTEIDALLARGLSYPWPAVAARAAEAIVTLKRKGLVPQLVAALDKADPREPEQVEKEGKTVHVVRELVKINHLRNCLLCHSPMDPARLTAAAIDGEDFRGKSGRGGVRVGLSAPVPLPGQELPTPTPSGGYGRFSVPDVLASFDVTYLRQDFSVKLPVADAKPWPETQRFDFLVRAREVTVAEADTYRALVKKANGDGPSPYRTAAVTALRQLTGKDAEPTAAAWRKALAEE